MIELFSLCAVFIIGDIGEKSMLFFHEKKGVATKKQK